MKKIFSLIAFLYCMQLVAQTPEEKLSAAGILLPSLSAPVANYVNAVRTGNLIFLSGKGPPQYRIRKPRNILLTTGRTSQSLPKDSKTTTLD